MFALTVREQCLLVALLCAAVMGAGVKHWRDARRVAQPANAAPAPLAAPRSADKPAAGRALADR
jgi:hypothetical protein